MNHKEDIQCPICLQRTFHITAYEFAGDFYNPPDGEFLIEQSCECHIFEEDWKMYDNLFMKLLDKRNEIGYLEHELLETEMEHSQMELDGETPTDMFVNSLKSYPAKIKNAEQDYKNVLKEIYEENYEKVI